jgi:hypothetical protein
MINWILMILALSVVGWTIGYFFIMLLLRIFGDRERPTARYQWGATRGHMVPNPADAEVQIAHFGHS